MEEDDDFGDLYSDVLLPFQSPPPPPPPSAAKIDLNLNSDDEEILYGNPNPNSSSEPSPRVCIKTEPLPINPDSASGSVIGWNLNLVPKQEDDQGVKREREDDKKDPIFDPIGEPSEEREDFSKFDIEEIGDLGPDNNPMREKGEEGEDWDSEDDSEDDLRIVLDDDKNHGLMGMENGEDDGDPLMMIASGEQGHVPIEEREWGEDAGQGGEGERKDAGDGTKGGGVGVGLGMKIGFGNHAYHPYHSQFKVR